MVSCLSLFDDYCTGVFLADGERAEGPDRRVRHIQSRGSGATEDPHQTPQLPPPSSGGTPSHGTPYTTYPSHSVYVYVTSEERDFVLCSFPQ